jgi:tRNA (mo5U34)-methyltransferase
MADRIFLACTPRTGSLWTRTVVARSVNLPSMAVNNPGEVNWSALPDRCLVAMHWRHSPAFESFVRSQGFRVLVTARHPLDVLVSILHFASKEKSARWLEGECGDERAIIGGTPDSAAFAAYCLSLRAEALLSVSPDWQPTADAVLRFEDAVASPVEAITRALEALGTPATSDVRDAVEASNLDQMRAIAGDHVWRGHPGDWRSLVPQALAAQVHTRHRRYFDAFGYDCDSDPALDGGQALTNWREMTAGREAAPAPPADAPDLERIREQVAEIPWFHHIDLGHGIVTPGYDIPSRDKIAFAGIPEDLTGKTVLDIGSWDGLFAFEAERRGASRVLATDSFVWAGKTWGTKAGFELARRVKKSRVEDMAIDVMDLDPAIVGTFDVVFFLGVLYHLRHPFLAIERVAAVTRERMILTTWADMAAVDRPAAAFYPKDELGGDHTNWWGLNPSCVRAMLADVGFTRIDIVSPDAAGLKNPSAFPLSIHAWKTPAPKPKT